MYDRWRPCGVTVCDLGFFPNSQGNKAAENLCPMYDPNNRSDPVIHTKKYFIYPIFFGCIAKQKCYVTR